MLKFKCPGCGAELAIGHPAVNPVLPQPPFSYFRAVPRGLFRCDRLVDVAPEVCEVRDAKGIYWCRSEDGAWFEIRAGKLAGGRP